MFAIIYPDPLDSPTGFAKVRLHRGRCCDDQGCRNVLYWLADSREFTRDDYDRAFMDGARIVATKQRDLQIAADALRIPFEAILSERPYTGPLASRKDQILERVQERNAAQ